MESIKILESSDPYLKITAVGKGKYPYVKFNKHSDLTFKFYPYGYGYNGTYTIKAITRDWIQGCFKSFAF